MTASRPSRPSTLYSYLSKAASLTIILKLPGWLPIHPMFGRGLTRLQDAKIKTAGLIE